METISWDCGSPLRQLWPLLTLKRPTVIAQDSKPFDEQCDFKLADPAHALGHCGPLGNTPVDLFPIWQYFPCWFLGPKYAQFAREWEGVIRKLYDVPFTRCRDEI